MRAPFVVSMTSLEDTAERLELCQAAARSGGAIAMESFRTPLTIEAKGGDPMNVVTDIDRRVQTHVIDEISQRFPGDPIVAEESPASDHSNVSAPRSGSVPPDGPAWIIDPIDGTNNYVAGNRNWMTSVAATWDGRPVAASNYMPATDDLYLAGPGDDSNSTGVTTRRNGVTVTPSDRSDVSAFLINPVFGLSHEDRSELTRVVDIIMSEFGDMRRFGCAQAALSGVATGEIEAAVSTVRLNDWDSVAGVHLVRTAGGIATDLQGDRWSHSSRGLIASNGPAHDSLVDAFGIVDNADGADPDRSN